jgi:crossover junction endodeoxyribonuclease RuvC
MLVLGLDPGIAKFGYGIVRHERGGIAFVTAGVLTTSARTDTPARLADISSGITALLDQYPVDRIMLERLVPGPGRNLGVVAEARGMALALAGARGIPVTEESPRAVKSLITRHGSATKLQMRRTVQRLLGTSELLAADAADALALAILGK